MGLNKLTLSIILGVMILLASETRADFLGLAPGDYTVTLNNSASSCGGSNCTGTIHIGTPGATGFDWVFTIGTSVFAFDSPNRDTHISSPLQIGSCAIESLGSIGTREVTVLTATNHFSSYQSRVHRTYFLARLTLSWTRESKFSEEHGPHRPLPSRSHCPTLCYYLASVL